MLLVQPGENDRAAQHWSTDWVVVTDPWLALAEALHQRREAAARAGWGLQPVGRPYVFSRGRVDGANGDAFRAALARWVPEAQLIELDPDATIEAIERQLSAVSAPPHPLRRNESAGRPESPRLASDETGDDDRHPEAPIPIRYAAPNAWSKRPSDSRPGLTPPLHDDHEADDANSGDDEAPETTERRQSVTPEELSALLASMDELMEGDEEMTES